MRNGRPARQSRPRPSRENVDAVVRRALVEDRASKDLTTRLVIPAGSRARAMVTAQATGILAGMEPAQAVARAMNLVVLRARPDGTPVRPGTIVLELRGKARDILAAERTLLNFLMHLSGVATLTDRVVRRGRTAAGTRTFRVLATRKTTPGLRDLEKAAVVTGGGQPHRRDLASAVLIKNNHLALVDVDDAVRRARGRRRTRRSVQVEVRSLKESRAAVRAGASSLLLDNVSPATAAGVVRDLRSRDPHHMVTVEASGGITLENVAAYARSGVDAVSLGALTHSAPALAFHLTLTPLRSAPRAT